MRIEPAGRMPADDTLTNMNADDKKSFFYATIVLTKCQAANNSIEIIIDQNALNVEKGKNDFS